MTMTSISGRVILRFPNRTKEKWLRFTPHQRFHLPTTQTPPHTASAGDGQDDVDDDKNDNDDDLDDDENDNGDDGSDQVRGETPMYLTMSCHSFRSWAGLAHSSRTFPWAVIVNIISYPASDEK